MAFNDMRTKQVPPTEVRIAPSDWATEFCNMLHHMSVQTILLHSGSAPWPATNLPGVELSFFSLFDPMPFDKMILSIGVRFQECIALFAADGIPAINRLFFKAIFDLQRAHENHKSHVASEQGVKALILFAFGNFVQVGASANFRQDFRCGLEKKLQMDHC